MKMLRFTVAKFLRSLPQLFNIEVSQNFSSFDTPCTPLNLLLFQQDVKIADTLLCTEFVDIGVREITNVTCASKTGIMSAELFLRKN
jgi:hypothetical protein